MTLSQVLLALAYAALAVNLAVFVHLVRQGRRARSALRSAMQRERSAARKDRRAKARLDQLLGEGADA